jgi:hypothetical protein
MQPRLVIHFSVIAFFCQTTLSRINPLVRIPPKGSCQLNSPLKTDITPALKQRGCLQAEIVKRLGAAVICGADASGQWAHCLARHQLRRLAFPSELQA